jgi:hypothetical protein
VLAQVARLGPRWAALRLLMALEFQAFMDESASRDEFVLGGYIQTAETWAKFALDWERLLPFGTVAKNGKRHFHMTEMAYYGKWSDVQKFYAVIDEYEPVPVSFRMNLDDFRSAQERMKIFAKDMNWSIDWGLWSNPYYFSFRNFLDEFHKRRYVFEEAVPLTEKVDFYFDDRSESAPIIAAWSEIRRKMPEETERYFGANPRFENDQDFLMLQAADLWSWWVRHWHEEDAADWPDKMRDFDFGSWRGKKRKAIRFSIGERAILERFKFMAVENLAEGNVDPMTLASLRGASEE